MANLPVRISPELFLSRFREVATEIAPKLISLWKLETAYTACVMGELIPGLAARLKLNYYEPGSYWPVDSIFFEEYDKVHFPSANYVKFISVAIEHENEPRTSLREMNKLQLFNTPLKVLVTYPAKGSHSRELLDKYEQIVRDADSMFGDTETPRRQLVIFGFHEDGSDVIEWEGYTFRGGSFVPVEVTPQTTYQTPPAS